MLDGFEPPPRARIRGIIPGLFREFLGQQWRELPTQMQDATMNITSMWNIRAWGSTEWTQANVPLVMAASEAEEVDTHSLQPCCVLSGSPRFRSLPQQ